MTRRLANADYAIWAGGLFDGTFTDTDPAHDPDGDGMTNKLEYAFGLDPTTDLLANPIAVPLIAGTFGYTRRAPALSGLTYTVWTSENLVDWSQDIGTFSQ